MITVADKVAASTLRHWSQSVAAGDVLKTWHDNGRGGSVYFWRVLKLCPRTIKARGENGEIVHKPTSWFNGRVDDPEGINV